MLGLHVGSENALPPAVPLFRHVVFECLEPLTTQVKIRRMMKPLLLISYHYYLY